VEKANALAVGGNRMAVGEHRMQLANIRMQLGNNRMQLGNIRMPWRGAHCISRADAHAVFKGMPAKWSKCCRRWVACGVKLENIHSSRGVAGWWFHEGIRRGALRRVSHEFARLHSAVCRNQNDSGSSGSQMLD